MRYLVTYDVDTTDRAGRRRLRKIAEYLLDYGQRVQFSVFEIDTPAEKWVMLRARIAKLVDNERDSVRIYPLDEDMFRRIDHIGTKKPRDLDEPIIV